MTGTEYTSELIFNTIGGGHNRVVMLLDAFFKAKGGDRIRLILNFNNNQVVLADSLILVVNAVLYAKARGVLVHVELIGCSPSNPCVQYASRIDFFKLLGVEVPEVNGRQAPDGRFMEIQEFNGKNAHEIHDDIMKVLVTNGVSDDMLTVFNFCMWEVIDNTLIHSLNHTTLSDGYGLVSCQFFEQNGNIRLMISDIGMGIHKGLTEHPNSRYKNLSESQALSKCIEKGVTNSEGKGFGLWATSELARVNKGCLKIFSGEHLLECSESVSVYPCGYWVGTSTFIEVNTKRPVDYKKIFGDSEDRIEMFKEYKENLFVNSNNLW